MGSPVFLASTIKGIVSPKGAPAHAAGSFTTNGASAPTVKGGIVSSVRRLEDGGALAFFRVKLSGDFPFSAGNSSAVFGVETVLPDAPAYATLVTDLITPVPADVRKSNEIDVAVFLHSSDARVDTAGSKVSIITTFER